jgi:hypothetical protein
MMNQAKVVSTSSGNIWVHPSVGISNPSPGALTRPYWISGPKCGMQQTGPELTDEEINRFLGQDVLSSIRIAEKNKV